MEDNTLILKFMGWESYNAYEINDRWECGDGLGGKQYSDVFVLNPTDLFLKHKAFGFNNEYGMFEDKKLYDDWAYNLNYHLDWNLLMPVVEKITNLSDGDENCISFNMGIMTNNHMSITVYPFEMSKDFPKIKHSFNCDTEDSLSSRQDRGKWLTDIEKVYIIVVKFIKWYNETKR
jgi:hypothetical protein